MPRPSPETITRQVPWRYRTYNSGWQTGTNAMQAFNRTYLYGEKTPGYPRKILWHNMWTRTWKLNSENAFYFRRYYTANPDIWDELYDCGNAAPLRNTPLGLQYNQNSVDHDPVAVRIAINRAMDAVADQKINLAQAFAERAQTVRLIGDTAGKLTGCLIALKRRKFDQALMCLGLNPKSGPKQWSKDLADNWLSLQYGWKPLLSDVYGGAEQLAATHMQKPLLIDIRKSCTVNGLPISVVKRVVDGGGSQIGDFRWSFTERRTTAKCRLRFEVTNDFVRGGSQLGITNPLLLAWELLPWSFVADWFLPVGDFLQKLSYDDGLSFKDGYVLEHTAQQYTLDAVPGRYLTPTGFTCDLQALATGSVQMLKFDRSTMNAPPRPVFPGFKDPFSPTHAANALALLRTAFRSVR